MSHQFTRFRAVTCRFLVAGFLLAIPLCWGCGEKGPGPESQQQSNTVETTIKTVQPIVSSSKIPLRVLYVGLPDTERQKDFVTFLGKHFSQIDTADYDAFTEGQTKDCDVAIFDKDGLEWKPLDINVSSEYSRATVSLGVPGAFRVRRVSQNMGYM